MNLTFFQSAARLAKKGARHLSREVSTAFLARLSIDPVDPSGGFRKGTPVDRYYIERFLKAHISDIRGHVLEVGQDHYSSRLGSGRITKLDILDRAPSSSATIVGDLGRKSTLPESSFDCMIFTQVLQYIENPRSAIETIHHALRPGGVVLATAPGISRIFDDPWFWAFSERSMRSVFCGPFSRENVEVKSYGNCFAATTFLQGLAVEDISTRKLEPHDEFYPICISVAARKEGADG